MAGDDPTGDRSIVRFEPNERVDLPDMKAVQDNARSESRLLVHNFLFGHGGMGTPNEIDATATGWIGMRSTPTGFAAPATSGLSDAESNHSQGGLCNFVEVDITGSIVTINVKYFPELFTGDEGGPQTGGYAGVALDNATIEQGFAAGCEGDDSQTLDMSGRIAGDYAVYFGGVADAGSPQTRLFWNANTNSEDPQAMDTRKLVGWNARCELLSAGPPNKAYQAIYVFSWDGAAVTSEQIWQNNLFEGLVGATSPHVGATGWGEDGSDGTSLYGYRSDDRATNGVACWQDWSALIRAQLRDIIGDGESTGLYGHWTRLPEFTGGGGSSAWTGERSSLTHAYHHIEKDTDPHGIDLTQTNLTITNDLTVQSLVGNTLIDTSEVYLKGDTASATTGVQVASNLWVSNNYNIALSDGSRVMGYNTYNGETIEDGRIIYSTFGCTAWQRGNEELNAASPTANLYFLRDVNEEFISSGTHRGGSGIQYAQAVPQAHQNRLHLPLNDKIAIASGTGTGAMRVWKVWFYFYSNPAWANGTYTYAATCSFKRRGNLGTSESMIWETLKSVSASQGNGGTVGDLNQPPVAGLSPTGIELDLSGEPTADCTIGGGFFGEEFELQVRLRGDGAAAFSPYFMGAVVWWKLGCLG